MVFPPHLSSTGIPDNSSDQAGLFGKTSKVQKLLLAPYTDTNLRIMGDMDICVLVYTRYLRLTQCFPAAKYFWLFCQSLKDSVILKRIKMPPFCSTWLQHGHTEQPLSLWSFQDLFSPQAPSWLDHQSPWESFWWKVTFVNSSHCTWSPNLGGVLLQVQLALTAGWPRHRTTFLLPGRSSMIVVENYLQLEIRRTRVYPGLVKSSAQPQPSLSGSIKFSPVSGFRSIGLQSFFLSTVEASLESLQRLLALPPVLVFYHTLLDKDFPLHFMR